MPTNLTVYTIEKEQAQLIVAAQNRTRAAALFKVTLEQFKAHGTTSNSASAEEVAFRKPGTVWARFADDADWVEQPTNRRLKDVVHGGFRAEAGRKPIKPKSPTKPRAVSMDDGNWALFLARGGSSFLRQIVDSGLDFTDEEWAAFKSVGGMAWLRGQLVAAMANK